MSEIDILYDLDNFYCQRDIEDETKCVSQCDHCKEYYKPLEKTLKDKRQLDLMATKCRTSSSAIYRYVHELLYKDKI